MRDKQKKALKKLKRLLERPRTMNILCGKIGCSDRTMYRYFDLLSEQGLEVSRAGTGYPVKFLIS